MVDEGVVDASPYPFDDDGLVNLLFSFTHINKYFEDERFEDISIKEYGFHGYNDAHFSYDDDDVGMDCWKLVEEPIDLDIPTIEIPHVWFNNAHSPLRTI